MASLRPPSLALLFALAATAAALKAQRARDDPMEKVGETAGMVGDSVDGVGRRVGADQVGDYASDAVVDSSNAVGNAANAVGANPSNIQHVPVVGQSFNVNAMSTSLSCIINLCIQYMIVYTALAVSRVVADWRGKNYDSDFFVEILNQAALTTNYAPMMACLFLACRMRVSWLTQGKGNPPTHVQVSMLCCTYALIAMTLVALVIPIFTGETYKMYRDPKHELDHGAHEMERPAHAMCENTCVSICFTVFKYIIMIGLYVGVVVVIFGIINYEPPKGSWPYNKIPPPAPAVACTMILTSMYFLVYAFIQACKTLASFLPSFTYMSKVQGALEGAVLTMAFAPMLSVLFIGARMRALMFDPINGHPQRWAQNCFYMCTYAVMAQCILAIAVPLVMGGQITKGNKGEGDVEYEVDHKLCGSALLVIRWIVMISVYLGFTCVIWSVFTIQHPKGPEYTPPISATMQCVINLTVQYFTVYLLIWIAQTVQDVTGWNWHFIKNPMMSAQGTVAFCPMLAILFVGTRMRALRLTNNQGAPQGYAQTGMYCATWAILIQFLVVCLMPIAIYLMEGRVEYAEVDDSGNIKHREWSKGGMIMMGIISFIRVLCFLLLYGGVIAVIVGAITMTPENATGRGSVPLVKDTPLGQEPKGLNDIPGVGDSQYKGPAEDMTMDDGRAR